jgi:hypothetical protein
MSRSYTSSPPSASMACNGTALPFTLYIKREIIVDRKIRISGEERTRHIFLSVFAHVWRSHEAEDIVSDWTVY